MTSGDYHLWKVIGHDMGLQFDELGHPYRQGNAYVLDGETYHHLHDFDPINDAGDAFRVQVHYGLTVDVRDNVAIVRDGMGPILTLREVRGLGPDALCRAAREAIFHGAGILISRIERKKGSSAILDPRISSST